jgi:hypothetical protein
MRKGTFEERFWSRVSVGDCWEWTGTVTRKGYGLVKFPDHRRKVVHRQAWEMLVGPIPDGLDLDHLCRNRKCLNPDHLEPVTRRENLMRGATLARVNAQKTHCPQRHPYAGANLGIGSAGDRYCRSCRSVKGA